MKETYESVTGMDEVRIRYTRKASGVIQSRVIEIVWKILR